ncbi:ABC transporter permease [Streptomyces beijiangensis]|uniref:ABC transporter permease n=1 Tax=Streptomyces beijiangensis TaxID=163361 RepID=A0A939JDK3_9ACTN|nr:ABC transporter permease [Streptomyces beijiangensis]MBO0512116.1 ABC transporter permease [Streptomyces beijiangensis]
MSAAGWARDLSIGAKFGVAGGREGWMRTLLTAVGVGLGVAVLLFTTAVPGALSAREDRGQARDDFSALMADKRGDTTLQAPAETKYHGKDVRGRLVRGESARAPVPPGLSALPPAGQMLVSPDLKKLLDSPEGKVLRERIPYKYAGTISDSGLLGPHELAYYASVPTLAYDGESQVRRISAYGATRQQEPMDPVMALLVVIIFIVLLMPVAVFIAAAVRFGGDRRDRRLAALRLVGADAQMTRRIAAGEALAGSLVGLVLGAGFFLLGRQFIGDMTLAGINLFPADVDPSPALAVLVALAVPAAAVGVTLLSMRGVVIEPLGVVRTAVARRRRLWWRLLLPAAGLALLYPMIGQGRDNGRFNQVQVISGTTLLLIGVVALLPWGVEAFVNRLGGGTTAWQLAVRRLQLTSGTAARTVNGIAVAVAGAIALQMLFAGIDGDYTKPTGADLTRAQLSVTGNGFSGAAQGAEMAERLRATHGVRSVASLGGATVTADPDDSYLSTITLADCASLREIASIGACKDGDTFVTTGGWDQTVASVSKPGQKLYVTTSASGKVDDKTLVWKLPADTRSVPVRKSPGGSEGGGGILVTPRALPQLTTAKLSRTLYLLLDPGVSDAAELARNTVSAASPLYQVQELTETDESTRFASVRRGLYIGTAGVLLLIGVSLLVSQLEQLRERKRLLAALVAFGTRRSTMSWSVLWQMAIPVALGLVLSTGVGVGLGAILLGMVGHSVAVNWTAVAAMTGIGAGVVLLVTLLSLPPLWRLMRPDGLRTE